MEHLRRVRTSTQPSSRQAVSGESSAAKRTRMTGSEETVCAGGASIGQNDDTARNCGENALAS